MVSLQTASCMPFQPFNRHRMSYGTVYDNQPSNLPNLRRLFVEARTEDEETEYSRGAVRCATAAAMARFIVHVKVLLPLTFHQTVL